MNHKFIDTEEKMCLYSKELAEKGREIIALDIEGESNLHQYGEKLCLIQIYDGETAVIIDPFKMPIHHIKELIENRSIMKIMFDAAGDRAFLYKNCGVDLKTVLDLQAAVLLLDYEKRDLSSVLKTALDIDLGKSKKKFQMYNWSRRPLSPDAVEYALFDVINLFKLKDKLMADIIARGLFEKFISKNLQVQNKAHIYNSKPKLLRTKTFDSLQKSEKAIFEKLLAIRERYAQKMNLPPNLVLANDLLFKLAEKNIKMSDVKFARVIHDNIKSQIIDEMQKAISGAD
ncbi:MAG TPA: HRDC domain-containing protein [Candidatus Wallbacteria bacterium]|nr:HRDC domain-containing protein [Candidatus Wallbacteria bacterium]